MAKIAHLDTVGRILDVWLPGKIFYDQTPGLAVGIVHRGKLVYAKGFGYADLENKLPVTPKTNFRIASISKMFTAIACLQLAEQKKLKLTDPVSKYLPWMKGGPGKSSIKHILSHTAGMLRDGDTPQWNTDDFPADEELKKSIERTDIVRKYRNRLKYSNFGFALLGQVIESASGMAYGKYLSKNILEKVGMENTYPDFTGASMSLLATGYSRFIPGSERVSFKHVPANSYAPAAGLVSNVSDLVKFIIAFTKGNSLLSLRSKKEMLKEAVKSEKDNNGYGLGCTIARIKGNAIIGHRGSFPGFVTRISIDVKNDLAVIVLTNSMDGLAREIATGILETIYDLPALLKKHGRDKIRNSEKYEGTYRQRWNDTAVVGAGKCLLTFNSKEDSPLKNVAVLVEKKRGVFEINSDNGYGSRGENATFTAQKMIWGGMESDKLHDMVSI